MARANATVVSTHKGYEIRRYDFVNEKDRNKRPPYYDARQIDGPGLTMVWRTVAEVIEELDKEAT